MYFDNVSLLSYNHTPKYFGHDFCYCIEKRFSIEGQLTDWSNSSGISGVIHKQHLLFSGANNYEPIYLNNILFGSGKIESIRLNNENLVTENTYVFDILCLDTGNLWNAVSGYLSGVNFDSNTHLLDSFSENLSWERDANGVQTYNHNIEIYYNRQRSPLSGINLAKLFAQNLFTSSRGLFPFLGNYSNLNNYKRLYAETYDAIKGGCGFSAVSKVFPNETNGFSYDLSYNLQLNEDGYSDITETCDIQGLYSPRAAYAESGFNQLITGSFLRASSVYSGYNFSSLALFSTPIIRSVSTNKFKGEKNFSNTYSNNPRYQTGAIWEYQNEVTQAANGYIISSENGVVKGIGRAFLDKLSNAESFYQNRVLTGIDFRLGTFYSGFTPNPHSLITIQQSYSKDQFRGEISYSRQKTDDNKFVDESGIKKVEKNVVISNPTHIVVNFEVFNHKEIVQSQNTNTLGEIDISLVLRGKRTNTLQHYLDYVRPIILSYSGYGTDSYLDDVTFSINPLNTEFTIDANYKFVSGYKTFGDLRLS